MLGCYSKPKTEECDQSNPCFWDGFSRSIPSSTIYFWDIDLQAIFLKQKRRSATKKTRSVFDELDIYIPCSATYSLEAGPPLWLEIAKKVLLEVKNQKFRFSGYFFKAKTEECDKKDLVAFDKSGVSIHCSATYFLKVGAHVSLKGTTKVSFRSTKFRKFSILKVH